ncbi:PREDICTED: uncharacterized protein LOC109175323 [Ipomoea nil]|uniref:uncharacterized protein LOC109175323 n=1 Tax=Ipomoea nil TaxID=35883 RepID=UPI000900AC5D|nr:PREDICTED: uncharacterized protein LOC109175323 [Ipomoea nil]
MADVLGLSLAQGILWRICSFLEIKVLFARWIFALLNSSMKEDQQPRVFCHSSLCKEEADLVFFEEKAAFDSNDPGLEISPLGSSVDRKDQIFSSDISSAAEFSHSDPDNSVIKCELHELTVYNVVKDICVDEGARGVDKISIERWTGDDQDKNRDIQEDDDSKLLSEDQSKPRDVDGGDVADECTTKEKEDIEPIVPDRREFSSEVDDSKGTAKDAFVESTNEQNSQMPSEETNTAEKNAENLPEPVLISEPLHGVENSDKTSASNAIPCSHNARGQLPELEDRPNPEDKASNYLLIASSRSDRFTDGETSFSAAGLVAYSGSISLRSDSSTTSTRSFAFPVLQSEWNGSPVRMAKPQKKGWRHSILCCRF